MASSTQDISRPQVSFAELYRTMRTIRRFDERIVDLVNANEIAGTTHEYVGEEAVAVGVCAALRPDDRITSTHRGHGHVIAKGADLTAMTAELLGRTTGSNRGRGGSMHIADLSLGILGANGIVAAGAPIAAGAAWASKQEGSDRVVACFFGDGGVNQGVLHETMNLATLWSLPLVFVCENNGYAVTLSTAHSTAGSIVERARAYGMPAEQVDGMDVLAVLEASERAVARARRGEGPSFLECICYRYTGHHTAERTMALSYRSEEEIATWRERDPLERCAQLLAGDERGAIDAEVEGDLDAALSAARAAPRPRPEEALEYVWASGPRPRKGTSART
jgi:pyruvate dehydrogenase E1 component alpha subunit